MFRPLLIIHSLPEHNLPIIGLLLRDSRALQSHDLSGEGINFGPHTYFFDHPRTLSASPDEGSVQCRGHLRDNTNMKDNTQHSRTHSLQQGEYERMIDGHMIFGDLKLPDICLTGEEKTPHPGNLS